MNASAPSRRPRRRSQAALAFTLLAAMSAAPLLTTGVSALGPVLISGLDLSRAEFGAFAVVLFTVTAVLSVPSGRLADVLNDRTGLVVNFVLALAALVVLAAATSFVGFMCSAVLGGAALAFSNPLTNRMVGLLADPSRRGSMIATKQVGIQVSQIITATIYPALASLLSWRAGFGFGAVLVGIGLLCVLLWLLPRALSRQGGEPTVPEEPDVSGLAHPIRGLAVLTAYAVLSGVIYQSLVFTLPLFAHEVLHFNTSLAAATGAVLGLAGLVSRLAWGALADRLKESAAPLTAIAAITLISVLLFIAAGTKGASWALWAGTISFGASGTAATVILTSAVLRHYSPTQAGKVSGIVSLGTFAGFAAGPFLFGAMADWKGYLAAWIVVAAVAAMATALPFALGPIQSRQDPPSRQIAARTFP